MVVAGRHVPNDELGALYASAGVVLSDHWADMRELGFVSNRTFDVLASGGRLFSDDVPGLARAARRPRRRGPHVVRPGRARAAGAARLARRAGPPTPSGSAPPSGSSREHSFDARARTLLDLALDQVFANRRRRSGDLDSPP